MSVTVIIAGNTAVLADGQWRSASVELRKLLNAHLESVQLQIPGHWPAGDRELESAGQTVKFFQGKILSIRRIPHGPTHMSDGRNIVF